MEFKVATHDERQPDPKANDMRFPVVGIGASAGGLEALEEFFQALPSDTGMGFVVLTHQHPEHTSLLPELLARKTSLRVVEVTEETTILPDHLYLGPPGSDLAIRNRVLRLVTPRSSEVPRLPIDHFFRSLAEDQQEQAVGIVLSGTGSDGTLGVTAIKGAGGMVMVQQPQSAGYAGMPSSAIATKLVDYVLTPHEMPQQLVGYVNGPYLTAPSNNPPSPSVPPEPLLKILSLLLARTGHDFADYKRSTIYRRIDRRMNVHQIESPQQYARYLQENPHEIDTLFKELLISVTSFFRDAPAWESLSSHLLDLIKARPEQETLRVWIPGCATGEEVYSVAIMLQESMEQAGRHHEIQIFGSDLDADAIAHARNGLYPDGIAVDVSPRRLERFFLREDGCYRIRKEIRKMVVFAPQNVIKDPPFGRLDLLSCRNLLIYLSPELQRKLLPIFHYALKPGGLLFLGSSETVGFANDLFEPLNKHWKIFRRQENPLARHAVLEMPAQLPSSDERKSLAAMSPLLGKEPHFAMQIERLLLGRFAPASVVVNDRGDIFYIHGRTGRYLEPAPGEPRNNVIEMAREGLRHELRAAIRECSTKKQEVTRAGLPVKTDGDVERVTVTVSRLQQSEAFRKLLLVTFQPAVISPEVKKKRRATSMEDNQRLALLQEELQFARESHQAALEELETSNEELKATNEELQSTNEELQSMNEELETSKEELQSLNEELTTVNAELHSKVDELSQTNDDMQNLLDSTDIGTVFLDNDLNIKRFTERAKDLVMLRASDVGRPIGELASNLNAIADLPNRCREVLKTLTLYETQVETTSGDRFLMRIIPYRTAENAIDGLVLTFVNIRQVEAASGISLAYFQNIFETVREPLLVLDRQLTVISANTSFRQTFHVSPIQIEQGRIADLGTGQWSTPKVRKVLEAILESNDRLDGYPFEIDLSGRGLCRFVINARLLTQLPDSGPLLLLAFEDVTSKLQE